MGRRNRQNGMKPIVLCAAILLVAVACGSGGPDATSDGSDSTGGSPVTSTPVTGPVGSTTPTSQPSSPGSDGSETIDAAVADLADRLDIDPGDIDVESHETVVWNDGSLGCPRPGEVYTQALVEGSRTVLMVDGRRYFYHAADGRAPFLCENPELAPGPGVTLPPDNDR